MSSGWESFVQVFGGRATAPGLKPASAVLCLVFYLGLAAAVLWFFIYDWLKGSRGRSDAAIAASQAIQPACTEAKPDVEDNPTEAHVPVLHHGDKPEPVAASRPRLFFLDTLKIFLTVSVVCHHIACSFSSHSCFFYPFVAPDYVHPWYTNVAGVYLGLQQSYFMALFFFISAYFVPTSHDRKGTREFLKDKVYRLGLPLLAFVFVLNPGLLLFITVCIFEQPVSGDDYTIVIGQQWFLQMLLVFNCCYAAVARLTHGKEATVRQLPGVGWLVLVGAVTGLLMAGLASFGPLEFFGVPIFFTFAPLYAIFFTAGVVARRSDWLTQIVSVGRTSVTWLVVVAVVSAGLMSLLSGVPTIRNAIPLWAFSLIYYVAGALFAFTMSPCLMVLFARFLNFSNRLTRSLSEACYAVYLIHGWTLTLITWSYAGIMLAAGEYLYMDAVAIQQVPLSGYYLITLGGIYEGVVGLPVTWGISWLLCKTPGLRKIL